MTNHSSFFMPSVPTTYLKFSYSAWRTQRIHALHRRPHEPAHAELDAIIRQFRDDGGLRHHFQAHRPYKLSMRSKPKPKRILELGSGTAKAVFFNYAHQNSDTSLTVVDEGQHWPNNVRQLAQIDDFDKRSTFIVAPKIEEWESGAPIARYDTNIVGIYKFALVDGPSLTIGGVKDKRTGHTNILPIIERRGASLIPVDIRAATVDTMVSR